MTPDKDWRFSAPLSKVDIHRIVKEAGPNAKCVRFTIGGHTFSAVNSRRVDLPQPPAGDITKETFVVREPGGDIYIDHEYTGDAAWKLYAEDMTGEVMDRVKVVVEVFE